jgi:hypothetical protein
MREQKTDEASRVEQAIQQPEPDRTPSHDLASVAAGEAAHLGVATLLALQRTAGNAAVARLVEGRRGRSLGDGSGGDEDELDRGRRVALRSTAGGLGRRPLQRHPLSDDERTKLEDELKEMNGLEINALLDAFAAKDAHTRAHYAEIAGTIAGAVHEERLRVCAAAVESKGGSVTDFALDHKDDLTAVHYIDQITAILRRVGPFDAKPLQPGDRLKTKLGADGAIYRPDKVRIRKTDALDWMACNPGAVAEGPSFKPADAYAGKTVGGAQLSVFPDDKAGEAALMQWLQFNAKRGMTFGGFFHAQAPTAEELIERWKKQHGGEPPPPEKVAAIKAATRGNNPETYLKRVAKYIGEDPEKVRGTPLAKMNLAKVAKGIQYEVEKWIVGDDPPIDDAIGDGSLPTETRFRLLFTKWSTQT